MSETKEQVKHTPGPWRVDDFEGCEGVSAINAPEDGGDIICYPPNDAQDSMRRWKANARLIAAAPELLEALKEAVALSPKLSSSWMPKAQAAIAKAEGR